MTEFKQIIGRGTRINENFDKAFFTIIDFKKATELFSDPDFDGEPVSIYDPNPGQPPLPPVEVLPPKDPPVPRRKYYVNDVEVSIVSEHVKYLNIDGELVTESLIDYTRKNLYHRYATLNDFLTRWNSEKRKDVIVKELEEQGIIFDALKDEIGKAYDPFDLICHVVFDKPALTRTERAERVRDSDYFDKYEGPIRKVLNSLLDKYADEGLYNLESLESLKLQPLNEFGTPIQIVETFGGKDMYLDAIADLTNHLYTEI